MEDDLMIFSELPHLWHRGRVCVGTGVLWSSIKATWEVGAHKVVAGEAASLTKAMVTPWDCCQTRPSVI